jgi:hypothetical protein
LFGIAEFQEETARGYGFGRRRLPQRTWQPTKGEMHYFKPVFLNISNQRTSFLGEQLEFGVDNGLFRSKIASDCI